MPDVDPSDLNGRDGLKLERLPDGRLLMELRAGPPDACARWATAYPLELILAIHAAKRDYACDEIMREEDPRYVERAIRHEVLGFVEPGEFAGKRVLDFGCGAGASTLVMRRLLPPCEIVGVELEERLLGLARLRAQHLGGRGIRFLHSPSGTTLPGNLGRFDFIVMSAVYEHLLPEERRALLPRLWNALQPGGVLFVNQTPHRYSPIEMHTTRLPLINYLPASLAHRIARRYARADIGGTWEAMLRAGIRGATSGEIVGLLGPDARLMEPRQGDLIDLWYGKLSKRHAAFKKGLRATLKAIKPLGGTHLVPELTLAIRKSAAG